MIALLSCAGAVLILVGAGLLFVIPPAAPEPAWLDDSDDWSVGDDD